MKYLFLDIDGVLNSTRSACGLGKIPHDAEPKDLPFFDLIALGLIRRLCEETGAKIVLSSTWRMGRDPVELGNQLDLPIISKTLVLDGFRGDEIKQWLDENYNPHVDKYAIVDDDSDMRPEQRPFFVKTHYNNGLLWDHYLQLKALLTDDETS